MLRTSASANNFIKNGLKRQSGQFLSVLTYLTDWSNGPIFNLEDTDPWWGENKKTREFENIFQKKEYIFTK